MPYPLARTGAFALVLLSLFALPCHTRPTGAPQDSPLRVFIRAGVKTHGPGQHDHPRFLEEWVPLLEERGAQARGAQRFPTAEELAATDVLVSYAAEAATIQGEERTRLEAFLARGGGLVIVHDAVCGDDPQWFKTVVGGAWEHQHSKWFEGEMGLYFADREHPITAGVSNFDLTDEIYWDLHMDEDAHVLANSFRTTHEIRPQMWTYEKANYRAFVSIPGHYHDTFSLAPYRTLLLRGIAWAGKRDAGLLVSAAETRALRYPEGGPQPGDEARDSIVVRDDFTFELVAAEPLIVNPISIDWDPRGRMWVAITPGYPEKEEFSGVAAHDKIVILEDGDGDGVMDSRKVFHEGLDLVTSLVFHEDGIIVTQAPDILFLRDTDGDDVADVTETLYTGFGYSDTHATISNLRWGLDGWVYGTQGYSGGASNHVVGIDEVDHGKIGNGLFRFLPDGSAIEVVVSYGSNTWGCDFSWDGELFFTMANGSHLRHVITPDHVLRRGRLGGTGAWRDITDHKKAFPVSKHERHPYLQIDFVGGFTGAAGCLVYDGGAWPQEFRGNHFVTEPTINLVHRDIVKPQGATFSASKPREAEFVAARDLWFRPVHVRTGPDGHVYVLDFYNQAAVHNDTRGPQHGPTNAALRPDRDRMHGRVWRVRYTGPDGSSVASGDWSQADPLALARALDHANDTQRRTAQRLLREAPILPRPAREALEQLEGTELARVNALWVLASRGELRDVTLLAGLGDPHPGVRKNAARIAALAGAGNETDDAAIDAALVKLLQDADPRVAFEATVTLGGRPLSDAARVALVAGYRELPDDWARSVAIGALARDPLKSISALITPADAAELSAPVRELVAILAREKTDDCGRLIAHLANRVDARPVLVGAALDELIESVPEDARPASTPELQGALRKLLSIEDERLAIAALPFASRWDADGSLGPDVSRLAERLQKTLADDEQDFQRRARCLTALLGIETERERAIPASALLLEPYVPLQVQSRVVELLGGVPEEQAADVLVSAFPAFSTKLREASFNELFKRSPWTARVLDAVESEDLTVRDLGPSRVFRLRNHPEEALAARANTIFDAEGGGAAVEIAELIEELTPIVSAEGDPKRGEELFNTHCGTCHTFGSATGKVGPELTGMGVHPPEELLPFVLDPNRTVEDNYVEYIARTWDGLSYGGVLVREDDERVVLRSTSGDVEIERSELELLRSTGRSPMPTGLQEIGAEELRDIFTWLRSEYRGFRVIDIAAASTANTQAGLYDPREPRTLEFTRFGVHAVDGVPFEVLDPTRSVSTNNVIVLRGGLNGDWHCKTAQPTRVAVPIGFSLERVHVLGGISAWGFPFTDKKEPAVRVTWVFEDGERAEQTLTDGVEFADWIRPHEVPGSEFVEGVLRDGSRGQLRRFAMTPPRRGVVSELVLESFDGDTAPTFVALTAELEGAVIEAAAVEPVTGTLIVGGGSSHDFARWFGETDVATLSSKGAADGPVTYTGSVGKLAEKIPDLDLLYLSNNQPLPQPARAAVEAYAAAGGGLLIVHASCWYSWNDWANYNRDFVSGGARSHEALGEFECRVVDAEHPVTAGLPATFRITDELYRFEPDADGPERTVLVTGHSLSSGDEFPVVWTVARDEGRTVCITLGHDGRAHELPEFQQLLQQAAAWARRSDAGGDGE